MFRSDYDGDDDDDDAVFGASSTTNNPFAVDDGLGDRGGNGHEVDGGFNPFATIADEEAVGAGDDDEHTMVFDPFQTILDDDALNVPFSSTDRDTEDDVTSPSRYALSAITPKEAGKLLEQHPEWKANEAFHSFVADQFVLASA